VGLYGFHKNTVTEATKFGALTGQEIAKIVEFLCTMKPTHHTFRFY
jgi:hypothetical protein